MKAHIPIDWSAIILMAFNQTICRQRVKLQKEENIWKKLDRWIAISIDHTYCESKLICLTISEWKQEHKAWRSTGTNKNPNLLSIWKSRKQAVKLDKEIIGTIPRWLW